VKRRRFGKFISSRMPKGLFARSLIIIIAPMILLQTVIVFVFMERHWNQVTNRLSTTVVQDIAALVDVIETYPQDPDHENVRRIARERLDLQVSFLEDQELPAPRPKPFISILDNALTGRLASQIGKPFWVDTVGDSDLLEIRIRLGDGVMRVFVKRKQAYASNSHIFLLWMVGAAIVLLTIAILFLRNQIRPIQRLAEAAERFGKGQQVPEDMRPRGASEVRRATLSFVEMRDRIERALEQRTAMLAGVSHDLRTVLTRFRLQLALSPQTEETKAMQQDVADMQNMLEGYLDFAKGDHGEDASMVDVKDVLDRFCDHAEAAGRECNVSYSGNREAKLRPTAFNRLLENIIGNAMRYAQKTKITACHSNGLLAVDVDDNGPGIDEAERERVFQPFVRLDEARNLDETGTGLGLAIARDIAHTHGGDVVLDDSPMGGLRVTITLPV
jgi:two-component system osmolarity sensor histidine kinase EnvZ